MLMDWLYGPNPFEKSIITFDLGEKCRAKGDVRKLTPNERGRLRAVARHTASLRLGSLRI
jgi:hypothetical protein